MCEKRLKKGGCLLIPTTQRYFLISSEPLERIMICQMCAYLWGETYSKTITSRCRRPNSAIAHIDDNDLNHLRKRCPFIPRVLPECAIGHTGYLESMFRTHTGGVCMGRIGVLFLRRWLCMKGVYNTCFDVIVWSQESPRSAETWFWITRSSKESILNILILEGY